MYAKHSHGIATAVEFGESSDPHKLFWIYLNESERNHFTNQDHIRLYHYMLLTLLFMGSTGILLTQALMKALLMGVY